MLRWYPDALLRVLLDVTLVPVAFVSVFVVMVLSDPSTQWASGPLSGHGLNSDLAVLVAAVGLGWILLALGWRGAGPVFRGALIAWHFTLASLSITTTARAKEFVLRGDAMDPELVARADRARSHGRHSCRHRDVVRTRCAPRTTHAPGLPMAPTKQGRGLLRLGDTLHLLVRFHFRC